MFPPANSGILPIRNLPGSENCSTWRMATMAGPISGEIAELLRTARTIAVVGLSSRKFRPSYGVSDYMKRAGYRIIPVNPNESELLGERCYATIEDVPDHIDIVDIFRRSEHVPEIVEAAIRAGAGAI